MKIEKRKAYLEHLYCAIHTLQIKTYDEIMPDAAEREIAVKPFQKRKVKGKDCYYYTVQLNLNKSRSDGTMITKFSEFKAELDSLLCRIGINEYTINRADLSLNSDFKEDYERFKKLNRLILCGLAYAYNITNCYVSDDLWTFKSLNTAIKGHSIEAENYDKFEESRGAVPTCNRLELRSKGLRAGVTLQEEFIVNWSKRLDEAISSFQKVQETYNNRLTELWYKDLAKPVKEREYINFRAFVLDHKDQIYTFAQLEDLVCQCQECENPSKKAKNLKDRHSIEFFSMTDLNVVIKGIKNRIIEYFAM